MQPTQVARRDIVILCRKLAESWLDENDVEDLISEGNLSVDLGCISVVSHSVDRCKDVPIFQQCLSMGIIQPLRTLMPWTMLPTMSSCLSRQSFLVFSSLPIYLSYRHSRSQYFPYSAPFLYARCDPGQVPWCSSSCSAPAKWRHSHGSSVYVSLLCIMMWIFNNRLSIWNVSWAKIFVEECI